MTAPRHSGYDQVLSMMRDYVSVKCPESTDDSSVKLLQPWRVPVGSRVCGGTPRYQPLSMLIVVPNAAPCLKKALCVCSEVQRHL